MADIHTWIYPWIYPWISISTATLTIIDKTYFRSVSKMTVMEIYARLRKSKFGLYFSTSLRSVS